VYSAAPFANGAKVTGKPGYGALLLLLLPKLNALLPIGLILRYTSAHAHQHCPSAGAGWGPSALGAALSVDSCLETVTVRRVC